MTKKLLVVAASGLVLAILLLSAAWIVGGKDLIAFGQHAGWHFPDGDRDGNGPTMTRTLAFDPAVPLTVDAAVDLDFVRGDHAQMTISGPARLVSAVRWENGRLSLGDAMNAGTLHVQIVAPTFPAFHLGGAGDVSLANLDQDALQLDIAGAGDIKATGKVRKVTVNSSGAGDVDLEHLNAADASVTASGVGSIDLDAGGKVDVDVSGVGNVTLHRKPAELTSQASGVGSVDQDY